MRRRKLRTKVSQYAGCQQMKAKKWEIKWQWVGGGKRGKSGYSVERKNVGRHGNRQTKNWFDPGD